MDSGLWSTRTVNNGQDGNMIEYFREIAATTVFVRSVSNPADQMYSDMAASASADTHSALSHSVLTVACQHLSNWSRHAGDSVQAIAFGDQASTHRSKALKLLRTSNHASNGGLSSSTPAIMVMMILASILKGEGDIIPSFLGRIGMTLAKIKQPCHDPFLPTISALHSTYTGLHSLGRASAIDTSALYPSWDERPCWQEKAKPVCEALAGVSKAMFLLLLRANCIVLELQVLSMRLSGRLDDEAAWLSRMELESEASAIKSEMLDRSVFEAKYKGGSSGRIAMGHEMYRAAIIMVVLRGVFHTPPAHPRLEHLVATMLAEGENATPGMEIGLMWPFIIIASEATNQQRDACMQFIKRCQWKGSAGPRIAEGIVCDVWAERDKGGTRTWRDFAIALGSPLIV